jgi:redox-sensitive bicupin YhaK (pirin superfamily)
MKVGFTHQDSLGISQAYGTTNEQQKQNNQKKHHSQWRFTGARLLHEEMFDASSDQELYSLWINVPSFRKLQAPDVHFQPGNDGNTSWKYSMRKHEAEFTRCDGFSTFRRSCFC